MNPIRFSTIKNYPLRQKISQKAYKIAENQWHHAALQGGMWITVIAQTPHLDVKNALLAKILIDGAEVLEKFACGVLGVVKKPKIRPEKQATNLFAWGMKGIRTLKASKFYRNLKSKTEIINAMYKDQKSLIKP